MSLEFERIRMVTIREIMNVLLAAGFGGVSWWYIDKTVSAKIRKEIDNILKDIRSSDIKSEMRMIERIKATYEDVLTDNQREIKDLKNAIKELSSKIDVKSKDKKDKTEKKDQEGDIK